MLQLCERPTEITLFLSKDLECKNNTFSPASITELLALLFETSSFVEGLSLMLSLSDLCVHVCLYASSCAFVHMSIFPVVCVALCRTLWTLHAL